MAILSAVPFVLLVMAAESGEAYAQSASAWPMRNSYVEATIGQRQQNYREYDDFYMTDDGILNAETGRQTSAEGSVRWQSTSGWLFQIEGARQYGATNYRGYLQYGDGSLTRYNSRTGNVSKQLDLMVGYALDVSLGNDGVHSVQWAPLFLSGRPVGSAG